MAVDTGIDVAKLKREIKKTYSDVSREPGKDFIFPTGREWALDLGYPPDLLARVPEETAASFALNGKPGVSEETRRRVLAVVEELQWTPNHAAQVLSGARSMTIGLAVARSVQDVGSELFFLRLITGMHTVLSARRYGLLFQVAESVED
jgi:DNA-binding LacI/PurR family transcriptional regulator